MLKKCLPYIPLCVILIALGVFLFSDLRHEITFEKIQAHQEKWKSFTQAHPVLSALIYLAVLTVSVTFLIPDTILMGVLAGFLFPLPLAIFYLLLGETVGAYLFYEAVGLALIPPLHRKKHAFIFKLEKKIMPNQISYLLFFRVAHLLPFWLVNTAAACFEIKRWTFIWTTFVGLIPFAYLLAVAGSGLEKYFATHAKFSLAAIFTTQVNVALLIIAILTLLPIVWKAVKKNR